MWRRRSDADKEHQRDRGRRGEKRGDTEMRVMEDNERKQQGCTESMTGKTTDLSELSCFQTVSDSGK